MRAPHPAHNILVQRARQGNRGRFCFLAG